MTTVYVPTVNDKLFHYDLLFGLWKQLSGSNLKVTLDFSQCGFLRQNAVAFLGGLIKLVEQNAGVVEINWVSLREDVGRNLARNGFRAAFGDQTVAGVGNAIPYREDRTLNNEGLISYLRTQWLGRGWVHVSEALRNAIVGTVWEIYANAFEHSNSAIGIFSCGQHFPRRRELNLAVADFGVGIPFNVRLFARQPQLPAGKALEWAFREGTTTKPNGMGRGLGLDLLKKFIVVNKGRLEVFSSEGYALIDGVRAQETYTTRPARFEGTLMNISLHCDESYYCLASEVPDKPMF